MPCCACRGTTLTTLCLVLRLTYWVVYAGFNILESFSDYVLYWIPFYYAVKLGFLIWLFSPSTRGAKFLYDHVLKPALLRGEKHIDTALAHAGQVTSAVHDAARNTINSTQSGATSEDEMDGKKSQ